MLDAELIIAYATVAGVLVALFVAVFQIPQIKKTIKERYYDQDSCARV